MKKELNKIDRMSAEEQYKYLYENRDKFVLFLDNDDTRVALKEDYNKLQKDYNFDIETISLKDFIGDNEGVFHLLKAIGLYSEGV